MITDLIVLQQQLRTRFQVAILISFLLLLIAETLSSNSQSLQELQHLIIIPKIKNSKMRLIIVSKKVYHPKCKNVQLQLELFQLMHQVIVE
jgi:hypothetical protein